VTELKVAVRRATMTLAEAGVVSAPVDALHLAAHLMGQDVSEVRRLMVLGGTPAPDGYDDLVAERAHRVPLQLAGQGQVGRTVDLEVEEGVEPRLGGEGRTQGTRLDRHGQRVDTVAVHDPGDLAGRPEAPGGTGADGTAAFDREGDLGHPSSLRRVPRSCQRQGSAGGVADVGTVAGLEAPRWTDGDDADTHVTGEA